MPRANSRERRESVFYGAIADIRAVEDCIRATRRYTEGIGTMRAKHPLQGVDLPSYTFCKYYEVYPETEVYWDMPANTALGWLMHSVTCVDVKFWYDYKSNRASVSVRGRAEAVALLQEKIPGFSTIISALAGAPVSNHLSPSPAAPPR